MKHLIQAVLFDLDGVVVFTDKYHYLAWKKLADEEGWDFDEEVNNGCRGVPRMASLQVILDHNNVDLPDDRKEELATRKNEYYKELLQGINDSDLYPGAVDFIKALRERGVLVGLGSSSKNAKTVLDALDLTQYFDAIITGHDFEKAKPDPEIFLTCAKTLGVPPFHCIVFEDAPSGVEAALAAKMKCVGVGSPEVLPNAPQTIIEYESIDVDALLDTGRIARPPVEPWALAETEFNPKRAQYWETLFALTNGILGLRGSYEEDDEELREHAYPGFFINSIYEYEPFHHIVSFPGYPQRRHVMINACDWRIIHLAIEGEYFSLFEGTVSEYRRELDMKRGVTVRSLVWESPEGHKVRIKVTRLVSMVRRWTAAIRYEATPLNFSGTVRFESISRGTAYSQELKKTPSYVLEQNVEDGVAWFKTEVEESKFRIGMAFSHALNGEAKEIAGPVDTDESAITQNFSIDAGENETVVLDKFAYFATSFDMDEGQLVKTATKGVRESRDDGFDTLLAEHEAFWNNYWSTADIEIDGNDADQQALRLTLFHLRQSHPEHERRSISACGITGDHYWGHVFWDTEMYIAPNYLYTQPELLRPLLLYRYNLLDKARQRAKEMQGIGALYSWNTINGEECGIIYEASTAEYHLVSAIAYGIWRYHQATGDDDFLFDYGAEILFETSRFLADRGAFVPLRGDQFCINDVCGPDEYGCGINNNCYTNVMAQWHFRFAADVYDRMNRDRGEEHRALAERIGLDPSERELWQKCADKMFIPFHQELGIHEQDDSFLYLDPVDLDKMPKHTDLREKYHPLNLWRMQVAKQADVVLLMLVQGDQFTLEQKRANYEFYEPRTNHGSSLSTSIHSIIASEIGKAEEAYDYFKTSLFMDLNDFKDNTAGGVHSACLGGTWMAVVHGFAGFRDYADGFLFNPTLPEAWDGYRFELRLEKRRVKVEVGKGADGNRATYTLLDGEPIEFRSRGEKIALDKKNPRAEQKI